MLIKYLLILFDCVLLFFLFCVLYLFLLLIFIYFCTFCTFFITTSVSLYLILSKKYTFCTFCGTGIVSGSSFSLYSSGINFYFNFGIRLDLCVSLYFIFCLGFVDYKFLLLCVLLYFFFIFWIF